MPSAFDNSLGLGGSVGATSPTKAVGGGDIFSAPKRNTTRFADTKAGGDYLSRFYGSDIPSYLKGDPGQPGDATAMGPGGVNTLEKHNTNKQFILDNIAAGTATDDMKDWASRNSPAVTTQPVGDAVPFAPPPATPYDTGDLQDTYDTFIGDAFAQAQRTLDPHYKAQQKAFEQRAIDQGLAPNSEAYNTKFDQMMREKNDAYSNAAFGAMGFGSERLDKDRDFGEGVRRYDETFDESQYQFDKTFDLNELMKMEGLAKTYRDEDFRDFLTNQNLDQQGFDNLFRTMGLAPGGNYQGSGLDTQTGYYSDVREQNRDDALWAGVGDAANTLVSGIDWSQFLNSKPKPSPYGQWADIDRGA